MKKGWVGCMMLLAFPVLGSARTMECVLQGLNERVAFTVT